MLLKYIRVLKSPPRLKSTDLDYVDNVALHASSYDELQLLLQEVDTYACQIGLQINVRKTKVMYACVPDNKRVITLKARPLEEFGASFLPTGQCRKEISRRIKRARSAFKQLYIHLWNQHDIQL